MMSYFTRSEPGKNLHRFYLVQLAPTLFDEWTLLCEWGRIGQPGTVRLTSFETYADAEHAARRIIKRRLQRGYRERKAGMIQQHARHPGPSPCTVIAVPGCTVT